MATQKTALHLAPHPDDETLGSAAALLALQEYGWRIVNVACSLGHDQDHDRRLGELTEATRRLGFGCHVLNPLAQIGRADDLAATVVDLGTRIADLARSYEAQIIVSPHPHDGHHGHEAVARAAGQAVQELERVTWWMWGLWADLPAPNVYFPFGAQRLEKVVFALGAYTGENARNDYFDLYPARARTLAILGAERVFGFGAGRASRQPYADLLMEVQMWDGRFTRTRPRLLDPREPLGGIAGSPIDWWVRAQSFDQISRGS